MKVGVLLALAAVAVAVVVAVTLVFLGGLKVLRGDGKPVKETFVHTHKVKSYSDKLQQLVDKLSQVHPIISTLDFSVDNTGSYTLDKKHVHLCIKDENGNYYDDNMLVYVVLHEVAHALCSELITTKGAHNSHEFLTTFNNLLNRAHQLGVYDPSISPVKGYCGTHSAV